MENIKDRVEELEQLKAGNVVLLLLLKFHLCRQIGDYPVFQAIGGTEDFEQLASHIECGDIDLKVSLGEFYQTLEKDIQLLSEMNIFSSKPVQEEVNKYQQFLQVIDFACERPYFDQVNLGEWLKLNLGTGHFSNTVTCQIESLEQLTKRKKLN